MKSSLSLIREKRTASLGIVGLMLAIALLGMMLALASYTSAHAQTPDNAVPSGTSASTTSSPADWTQLLRDNMQRWNPYETVLGVKSVGNLQLKWKNPVGLYTNAIESSPAVVNGLIYFGSDDGNVYALNASTGTQLWKSYIGSVVFSSPAQVNGVLYFGAFDGHEYAVNASTGAKIWSSGTGSNVLTSPAVVNGVVYFGSDDHNVYALNASTGAKLWSFATGDIIPYSSPAVVNGVVYIGSWDNNVYALNASTGAKLWSFATGGQ